MGLEADTQTVKQNQAEYGLPLKILSYDELYGWTMDRVVDQVGKKNNCTFCGVFRRQALDRGAAELGIEHIVTGHNADDIAETVLMNSKCDTNLAYALSYGPLLTCSPPRRRRASGPLHGSDDPGRGHDQALQALQVRIREGDRHVSSSNPACS